jgi:serine/threonine protein kinase
MSPEQARGNAILTPQSDQFSLGLVLYELCAGKRAFSRPTKAETMTAIIREDAEPLPASVPAPLRWTIERLLAKDPADRYDSTRDLYRELRQIRERSSESVSAQAAPATRTVASRHRRMAVIAAVAAGPMLGAVLTLRLMPRLETAQASYKFTPIARHAGMKWDPVWSPDGKSIAYDDRVHGNSQIFVKAIGSADTTQLTREVLGAGRPLWSPDGATIYYHSGGGLRAVPASGLRNRSLSTSVLWPFTLTARPQPSSAKEERGRVNSMAGRPASSGARLTVYRMAKGCPTGRHSRPMAPSWLWSVLKRIFGFWRIHPARRGILGLARLWALHGFQIAVI